MIYYPIFFRVTSMVLKQSFGGGEIRPNHNKTQWMMNCVHYSLDNHCGVIITWLIFTRIITKIHPIACPQGCDMKCFLCVQTFIHIWPQSLPLCVQYHVILQQIITACDCSVCAEIQAFGFFFTKTHTWEKTLCQANWWYASLKSTADNFLYFIQTLPAL